MSTRLPSPPRAPLVYDGPRLSDLIAEADQLAGAALQLGPAPKAKPAPLYTLDGLDIIRNTQIVGRMAFRCDAIGARIVDLLNQHGEG